jgi:hypothetical protein
MVSLPERAPRTGRAAAFRAARAATACGATLAAAAYYLSDLDAHSSVGQWFVWRLILIWGYALIFAVSTFAFGAGVLGALLPARRVPIVEWVLQALALGLVGIVLGLYLLGVTGGGTPAGAMSLPAALLAVSAPSWRRTWRELSEGYRHRPQRGLAVEMVLAAVNAYGVVCLALVILEALDPSEDTAFDRPGRATRLHDPSSPNPPDQ